MKYLSLFSGIGGFELGIKQAYEQIHNLRPDELADSERPEELHNTKNELQQWECVGYSEIDKHAIQIYQSHFNHKNYGDITKINESELPDFELLCGGFPCQSFSIAGKRGGFNDTRGTMFFHIARILKAKQPRLLLLENVKGLLSHDEGRTFTTIIATLDELGYDLQWQVLNSKNFGVPQNRERVFIIGHLRGTSRPEVFPFGESNGKVVKRIQADVSGKGYNSQQDRTYFPDSLMGCLPSTRTENKVNVLVEPMKIRRLTPTECERLQGFPEAEKYAILKVCKQVNANGVEITLNTKATDQENVAQVDVLIDCVENGVEIHSQGKLLLNAKNVEKKNWSHPLIKIDDFVQLLVGINIIKEKVIRLGEEELHQNEQSLTPLKSGKKQEKLSGREIMQPVGDVKNDSITLSELLKLTTLNHSNTENLEQKLQTLSLFVIRAINGYIPSKILNQNTFTIGVRTRVGHTYGVSDTQRYKTLGNAVTVNVIEAILARLLNR